MKPRAAVGPVDVVDQDVRGQHAVRSAATGGKPDGHLRLAGHGHRDEVVDPLVGTVSHLAVDHLAQGLRGRDVACRNGGRVVLNVARWVKGVPGYGASLATYRQYMVNHEVGHKLAFGHERCPGRDRPAPAMQQQTLGRHGCTANAWPYPEGKVRYSGPAGADNDEIPRREGAHSAQ